MTIRNNDVRPNKPFCKVCKDAGKSETDYTSHWVKSYDKLTGKKVTTCPLLLSQECRYCHELGHTTKYCQVLADKNTTDNKKDKQIETPKNFECKEQVQQTTKKVTFSLLAYDSDEDEIVGGSSAAETHNPVLTGWAAIVAKPAPVVKPNEPESVFKQLNVPTREKTPLISEGLKPVAGWVKPVLTRSETLGRPAPTRIRRSWADDTSSDEEDDIDKMLSDCDTTW